jgi:hypothetical protein
MPDNPEFLKALKKELATTLVKGDDEWIGFFTPSTQEDIDWLRHVGKLMGVISHKEASGEDEIVPDKQ